MSGGASAPDLATASAGRVRLHITPFHADLLERFVPPSLRSQATGISFHTVPTFPERGFGFVELPAMEAQKLRRKFGGTTLRGAKVKIEEAKPDRAGKGKKRKADEGAGEAGVGEEEEDDEGEKKKKKKKVRVEKAKRGEGVYPGHELETGRRVKRGWEDDAASKKKAKKAGGEDHEGLKGKKGLFKTSVPPNSLPVKRKASKEHGSSKRSEEGKSGKKSIVVKEFKNATKLSSTGKAAKSAPALQYEDGKGWVDEEGTIVEPETASTRRKRISVSSRADTSSRSSRAGAQKNESKGAPSPESAPVAQSDQDSEAESDTSSDLSSSSAEASSDDDESEEKQSEAENPRIDSPEPGSVQQSLVPTKPPTQSVSKTTERDASGPTAETPAQATASKEVHPLEALYKRPAPTATDEEKSSKPTRIDTSFSFFSAHENVDDDEMDDADGGDLDHPPQTPHTKRDLEWRSIRSAAPTPDTAAIGKRFEFPFDSHDVDDDDDDDDENIEAEIDDEDDDGEEVDADGAELSARPVSDGVEESEFRKWFYENRGDLNRSWKKRRREEKKLQRQRESRRLGRKLA